MKNSFIYILLVACSICACEQTNTILEQGGETPSELVTVTMLASSLGSASNTRVNYADTKFQWDAKDEIAVNITASKHNNNSKFTVAEPNGATAPLTGEIVRWDDTQDHVAYAVFPYSETNTISAEGSITFTVPNKHEIMVLEDHTIMQGGTNNHGYLLAKSVARGDISTNHYMIEKLAFEQVMSFLKFEINIPTDEHILEIRMVAKEKIFTTKSTVTISDNTERLNYNDDITSKTDTIIATILKDIHHEEVATKKLAPRSLTPSPEIKPHILNAQIAMFPGINLSEIPFVFYIKTTYKKADISGTAGEHRDYIMYEMHSDQLKPLLLTRNHIYKLQINLNDATHYPTKTAEQGKRIITKYPAITFLNTHYLNDEIVNLPASSFPHVSGVYSAVKKIVVVGSALDENDFDVFNQIDKPTTLMNIEYIDISKTTTTSIKYKQFYGDQSLKEILLPETIHSFSYSREAYEKNRSLTFAASGLESITIPENFKDFGGAAFYNCAKLTSVTILNLTPPTMRKTNMGGSEKLETFDGCDPALVLYVPSTALAAYQEAYPEYTAKIQAITP